MKKIIWVLLILIVLGGGYYFYKKSTYSNSSAIIVRRDHGDVGYGYGPSGGTQNPPSWTTNNSSNNNSSAATTTKTTPKPIPAPTGPKTYTLADVASHSSSSSCWSAISGKVYDLTSWIGKHPGGSQAILSICGKDGTQAFDGQHGMDPRAKGVLPNFYLGNLAN
jgi:cytochrome b involved in lipid metabolism